jgi:ABC-type branched-subunit amino acid transport system substrate-binding protein
MRTLKAGVRFLCALSLMTLLGSFSASAQRDAITIAIILDLSGSLAERSAAAFKLYDKYIADIGQRGGVSIGSSKYPVKFLTLDAGSSPALASTKALEAIQRDKADLVICSYLSCVSHAETGRIPLILTASATTLTGEHPNTFLIGAPSYEDHEKQATLAIRTLDTALTKSAQPNSESIAAALRSLNLTIGADSVRFNKNGNLAGKVSFPVRASSRPDAAGCTGSCARDCPSNCGQTTCTKQGDNMCCNICGMPPN